jgi:hypothetical protein
MRRFLGAARAAVLGETWRLPIGIALAVGTAALLRAAAGPDGWWRDAGGLVLLAGLTVALVVALRR